MLISQNGQPSMNASFIQLEHWDLTRHMMQDLGINHPKMDLQLQHIWWPNVFTCDDSQEIIYQNMGQTLSHHMNRVINIRNSQGLQRLICCQIWRYTHSMDINDVLQIFSGQDDDELMLLRFLDHVPS